MMTAERLQKIMILFKESQYLSVKELCECLHFSESTIRRDLKNLEHEKLLTCLRGGAVSENHPNYETPLTIRQTMNRPVKCQLAKKAAELVKDNHVILMDSSSTVIEMIPHLRGKKHLTIITCCLRTAATISEQLECTLICTGGRYHPPADAFVGSSAEKFMEHWFADIMFFSVNSVDAKNQLTDQAEEIAHMKVAMLSQAKKTVLLADSTKFGRTSVYRLCALNDVSFIITNPDPVFNSDCWKEHRSKMMFSDL
jgi:DeoR family transcriptional regulator, fructose operon transcriptional repressor